MSAIPGVGDGAFGSEIGGRCIVNAYSNASRTLGRSGLRTPAPFEA
jgi:hypothetical protein